jgi:hypothetical protein
MVRLTLGAAVALAAATVTGSFAAVAPERPMTPATAGAVPSLVNGDTFTYTTNATTVENGFQFTRASTDVDTVAFPVPYGGNPTYRLSETVTDTSDPNASLSQVYFRFVPDGRSTDLVELGWNFTMNSAAQGTEADQKGYGLPFYRRFQYPERTTSWANDLPATVKLAQSYPNGSAIAQYYRLESRGSYSGWKAVSGQVSGTTSFVLDGNGAGALKLPGSPSQGTYQFGVPISLDSSYVIPVTLNGTTTDVPDWYPGAESSFATPPLAQSVAAVAAISRAPAICGARAGSWAYETSENVATLDPVQGIYTTTATQYYDAPAFGLICFVQTANEQMYDNLQTGQLGTAIATTTVSVLTSEALASGQSARVAAIPRNPLLSPPGSIDAVHRLAHRELMKRS